jgi:hypothetical protein
MITYPEFIIFALIVFELPKGIYLLNAQFSGEYYLLPQFTNVLNTAQSHSSPLWLLSHWIVAITTILISGYSLSTPFTSDVEKAYKYSHFTFISLVAFNIFNLGGLPSAVAFVINGLIMVILAYTGLSLDIKERGIRWIDFIVLSTPILLDILAFIAYCITIII